MRCREDGSQARLGESWAHDLVVLAWDSVLSGAVDIHAGIFPFHPGHFFHFQGVDINLSVTIIMFPFWHFH